MQFNRKTFLTFVDIKSPFNMKVIDGKLPATVVFKTIKSMVILKSWSLRIEFVHQLKLPFNPLRALCVT